MFLGIKYNTWHFILAFFGSAIGLWIMYQSNGPGPAAMLYSIGMSAAFILFLQAMNEFMQLKSDKSIRAHGGYKNFIIDSRDDWRKAILGTMAGTMAGAIITLIIT